MMVAGTAASLTAPSRLVRVICAPGVSAAAPRCLGHCNRPQAFPSALASASMK